MHRQSGLPRRQAGQIATVLTLIAMGLITVGISVGTWAVKNPTSPFYSKATTAWTAFPTVPVGFRNVTTGPSGMRSYWQNPNRQKEYNFSADICRWPDDPNPIYQIKYWSMYFERQSVIAGRYPNDFDNDFVISATVRPTVLDFEQDFGGEDCLDNKLLPSVTMHDTWLTAGKAAVLVLQACYTNAVTSGCYDQLIVFGELPSEVEPTNTPTPTPTPTTIPSNKPDLIVFQIVPNTDSQKIEYTVKNIGNDRAGNSYSKLIVDDTQVTVDKVFYLEAGEKRIETFEDYSWSCTGEKDTIQICADMNNNVEESESGEQNNCASIEKQCGTVTPTLTLIPSNKPDLVLENILPNPQTQTIQYRIKNPTNIAAGTSQSKLVIDGSFKAGDTVDSVAANTTNVETFPNYTWICSGDSDKIEVYLDVNHDVNETNEDNNYFSIDWQCGGDVLTPTPTITPTLTPTLTPTVTATATPTPTATLTPAPGEVTLINHAPPYWNEGDIHFGATFRKAGGFNNPPSGQVASLQAVISREDRSNRNVTNPGFITANTEPERTLVTSCGQSAYCSSGTDGYGPNSRYFLLLQYEDDANKGQSCYFGQGGFKKCVEGTTHDPYQYSGGWSSIYWENGFKFANCLKPVAPTDLQVTQEYRPGGKVKLTFTWKDNATNEDGYQIYYMEGTEDKKLVDLPANTTSYTTEEISVDTCLKRGLYGIVVFNGCGEAKGLRIDRPDCHPSCPYDSDAYICEDKNNNGQCDCSNDKNGNGRCDGGDDSNELIKQPGFSLTYKIKNSGRTGTTNYDGGAYHTDTDKLSDDLLGPATVTLNMPPGWKIEKTYCQPRSDKSSCPANAGQAVATLDSFEVACGAIYTYGWILDFEPPAPSNIGIDGFGCGRNNFYWNYPLDIPQPDFWRLTIRDTGGCHAGGSFVLHYGGAGKNGNSFSWVDAPECTFMPPDDACSCGTVALYVVQAIYGIDWRSPQKVSPEGTRSDYILPSSDQNLACGHTHGLCGSVGRARCTGFDNRNACSQAGGTCTYRGDCPSDKPNFLMWCGIVGGTDYGACCAAAAIPTATPTPPTPSPTRVPAAPTLTPTPTLPPNPQSLCANKNVGDCCDGTNGKCEIIQGVKTCSSCPTGTTCTVDGEGCTTPNPQQLCANKDVGDCCDNTNGVCAIIQGTKTCSACPASTTCTVDGEGCTAPNPQQLCANKNVGDCCDGTNGVCAIIQGIKTCSACSTGTGCLQDGQGCVEGDIIEGMVSVNGTIPSGTSMNVRASPIDNPNQSYDIAVLGGAEQYTLHNIPSGRQLVFLTHDIPNAQVVAQNCSEPGSIAGSCVVNVPSGGIATQNFTITLPATTGTISGTVTVNSNGRYYDLVGLGYCGPTGGECPRISLFDVATAVNTVQRFPYEISNLTSGSMYKLTARAQFTIPGGYISTNWERVIQDSNCPTPGGGYCLVTAPGSQNFTINLPDTFPTIPAATGTISARVTIDNPSNRDVEFVKLDVYKCVDCRKSIDCQTVINEIRPSDINSGTFTYTLNQPVDGCELIVGEEWRLCARMKLSDNTYFEDPDDCGVISSNVGVTVGDTANFHFTIPAGGTGTGVQGDISGADGEPDGVVDELDLAAVVGNYFAEGAPGTVKGDPNGDGRVDALDLSLVVTFASE